MCMYSRFFLFFFKFSFFPLCFFSVFVSNFPAFVSSHTTTGRKSSDELNLNEYAKLMYKEFKLKLIFQNIM